MNINGEYGVVADNVSALDSTASIHLGNDQIDLTATTILVNGQLIGTQAGYVTNPMSTNLNCSNKNLTNVNLINGIDIETMNTNLNTTMTKTIFIDSGLYIDGTHFNNNIYADKFIINGNPSPAGFLMSDGTILNNSSTNNNSNIYPYNNSTATTEPPNNGQIRFNNVVQQNSTEIYISHLTRTGTDIDTFLALISQLSVVYLQQDDDSQNYIKFNVNSNPVITPNSYITISVSFIAGNGNGLTSFGNGMNIFLSIFSNDVEIDSRISNLETKTQNQSATSTYTLFNKSFTNILDATGLFIIRDSSLNALLSVAPAESDIFNTLNMNTNRITGLAAPSANSDSVNKQYVDNRNTALATQMPYVSTSGIISGASKDFFIESGVTTIQTAINNATAGTVIRLSSSAWTESPVCSGQNYTICGAPCADYAQTTQITGNFQIGASSPTTTQTRIRLKDLKIGGNILFAGSLTHQQLRTYFDNCDISGTVTITNQVATVAGGTNIYFNNCSFSGSNNPLTSIPNQTLFSVYFTNCTFNSQPITNNLTAGNATRLVYTNCSTLPSLSLGNCILNGLNASASVSSLTAGSITLGGTSSQFLLGNGSTVNASPYTQMTTTTPTVTFIGTNAGTGTNANVTLKITKITNGTNTVVTMSMPAFTLTMSNTAFTLQTSGSTVLASDLRPTASITYFPCQNVKTGTTFLNGIYLNVYNTGMLVFNRFDDVPTFWTLGAAVNVGPNVFTWNI